MAAGHGFNFVETVVGADTEPLASCLLVAAILLFAGLLARKSLDRAKTPLVPDEKLSVRNLGELLASFIVLLGDTVMGKENRKFYPFVGVLFIYIFLANMLGMIPGFSMPTDGIIINLGLGLLVFFLYNFWGIREVGIVNYLKHLCGPIWWLAPFLLCVELISHIVRPFSLSLRLYGNMTGDHMVLEIFTELTKFGIPVIFYALGTFVCFMQAFVFALLTMIYIRLAVAHEEGH